MYAKPKQLIVKGSAWLTSPKSQPWICYVTDFLSHSYDETAAVCLEHTSCNRERTQGIF